MCLLTCLVKNAFQNVLMCNVDTSDVFHLFEFYRENGSLMDEAGCSNTDKLSFDANGAFKEKKEYEMVSET